MNSTPNTLAAALAPFKSHGERKRARRAPKQRATVAPSPILRALVSRFTMQATAARAGCHVIAEAPYVAPWHGVARPDFDPLEALRAAVMEARQNWPTARNPYGV